MALYEDIIKTLHNTYALPISNKEEISNIKLINIYFRLLNVCTTTCKEAPMLPLDASSVTPVALTSSKKHILKSLRLLGLEYLVPKPNTLYEKKKAFRIISALHDKITTEFGKDLIQRVNSVVKREQLMSKKNLGKDKKLESGASYLQSDWLAFQESSTNPTSGSTLKRLPPTREMKVSHPMPPPDIIIPIGRQIPRTPLKGGITKEVAHSPIPMLAIPSPSPVFKRNCEVAHSPIMVSALLSPPPEFKNDLEFGSPPHPPSSFLKTSSQCLTKEPVIQMSHELESIPQFPLNQELRSLAQHPQEVRTERLIDATPLLSYEETESPSVQVKCNTKDRRKTYAILHESEQELPSPISNKDRPSDMNSYMLTPPDNFSDKSHPGVHERGDTEELNDRRISDIAPLRFQDSFSPVPTCDDGINKCKVRETYVVGNATKPILNHGRETYVVPSGSPKLPKPTMSHGRETFVIVPPNICDIPDNDNSSPPNLSCDSDIIKCKGRETYAVNNATTPILNHGRGTRVVPSDIFKLRKPATKHVRETFVVMPPDDENPSPSKNIKEESIPNCSPVILSLGYSDEMDGTKAADSGSVMQETTLNSDNLADSPLGETFETSNSLSDFDSLLGNKITLYKSVRNEETFLIQKVGDNSIISLKKEPGKKTLVKKTRISEETMSTIITEISYNPEPSKNKIPNGRALPRTPPTMDSDLLNASRLLDSSFAPNDTRNDMRIQIFLKEKDKSYSRLNTDETNLKELDQPTSAGVAQSKRSIEEAQNSSTSLEFEDSPSLFTVKRKENTDRAHLFEPNERKQGKSNIKNIPDTDSQTKILEPLKEKKEFCDSVKAPLKGNSLSQHVKVEMKKGLPTKRATRRKNQAKIEDAEEPLKVVEIENIEVNLRELEQSIPKDGTEPIRNIEGIQNSSASLEFEDSLSLFPIRGKDNTNSAHVFELNVEKTVKSSMKNIMPETDTQIENLETLKERNEEKGDVCDSVSAPLKANSHSRHVKAETKKGLLPKRETRRKNQTKMEDAEEPPKLVEIENVINPVTKRKRQRRDLKVEETNEQQIPTTKYAKNTKGKTKLGTLQEEIISQEEKATLEQVKSDRVIKELAAPSDKKIEECPVGVLPVKKKLGKTRSKGIKVEENHQPSPPSRTREKMLARTRSKPVGKEETKNEPEVKNKKLMKTNSNERREKAPSDEITGNHNSAYPEDKTKVKLNEPRTEEEGANNLRGGKAVKAKPKAKDRAKINDAQVPQPICEPTSKEAISLSSKPEVIQSSKSSDLLKDALPKRGSRRNKEGERKTTDKAMIEEEKEKPQHLEEHPENSTTAGGKREHKSVQQSLPQMDAKNAPSHKLQKTKNSQESKSRIGRATKNCFAELNPNSKTSFHPKPEPTKQVLKKENHISKENLLPSTSLPKKISKKETKVPPATLTDQNGLPPRRPSRHCKTKAATTIADAFNDSLY